MTHALLLVYALAGYIAAGLLALLWLAVFGFVCYSRGLATGRRLGAQSEQAFAHRRNRQAVHFDGARTWWNANSRN